MSREVFDSFAGFDDFLVYLAVSLAYLAVFVAIYIRITPYREMQLIREGNMAASFSLSGAILGFIVPLASAIQHSVSLVDMAIWGLVAMVVQIAAFVVVKLCIPSITRDIPEGKGAQGFFLGSLSLGVGLLNAACMSF
jgi:putative membrane protein